MTSFSLSNDLFQCFRYGGWRLAGLTTVRTKNHVKLLARGNEGCGLDPCYLMPCCLLCRPCETIVWGSTRGVTSHSFELRCGRWMHWVVTVNPTA